MKNWKCKRKKCVETPSFLISHFELLIVVASFSDVRGIGGFFVLWRCHEQNQNYR
jgi:hypothetical protein